MATATKKTSAPKKASSKKAATEKSSTKRATTKKAASKKSNTKTNKLGVKNSLVNNINAHKKKGDSKTKTKSTIEKKEYNEMEKNWDKEK